ncbi:gp436 family protein [Bartonella sp. AP3QHHD]|uniref:gp436 family protein n=1 Tax=Bartonella sp. AP3QHHD TaxID=3243494 RepID=UPI0035D02D4A
MAYASKRLIEELWGVDFLTDLCGMDENSDPVLLEQAIGLALEQASGEIDVHLSHRYCVPIVGQPAALGMICVNIAVYNLAIRHTALTTTIEDRYKQAVDLLKRIAEGKAGLGVDEPKIMSEDGPVRDGAFFHAKPRLMGR